MQENHQVMVNVTKSIYSKIRLTEHLSNSFKILFFIEDAFSRQEKGNLCLLLTWTQKFLIFSYRPRCPGSMQTSQWSREMQRSCLETVTSFWTSLPSFALTRKDIFYKFKISFINSFLFTSSLLWPRVPVHSSRMPQGFGTISFPRLISKFFSWNLMFFTLSSHE